ncbi:glycosyltransferase family 2 protein [Chitinophaga lutea]
MPSLISIVIPVYNGEAYLRETLDSIFRQTYPHYEVIVSDGGSKDGTLAIIAEYRDRIAHVRSGPDEGMYDALQRGFQHASGDIFCYINADDRLLPDTLEKVARTFSRKDCDLVFGDVNFINESGDVIFSYKGVNLSSASIRRLRRVPFAQQSSFWTREAYARAGGFDKTLRYVADSKFLLSLCVDPSLRKAYIPSPLGEYRLHGGSFSVSVTGKMQDEHFRMLEELPLLPRNFRTLALEAYTKLRNLKGIYQKLTYKGTKF